jgi:polysaccharide chain length determinant protein (PEP-CTERM system associated)
VPQPIGKQTDSQKGPDSFILGYTDSDPQRAQRIANRLAYVFAEENSKQQLERSENTSEILSQQLQASLARLTRLEAQLRDKRQAYMGRLPDQVNANVQMLNGLRSQLESISTQIRGEQDRLTMVEGQLEQMRQGTNTEVFTTAGAQSMQMAQKRIGDLQQQLVQARAQGYTDKHPMIITLKEELQNATDQLANARGAQAGNALQGDPAYRQKLQERETVRLAIRDMQRASQRVESQISQYQARVDAAPMVEQELTSLTREYAFEKTHYGDLMARHQQASMAEDLTRKQGGERFSVLFPANQPSRPQKPDQLRIMALAVAAGFVLGAVAAVGREFLDRSVHDARALNEFEVPVLGEIPRIPA